MTTQYGKFEANFSISGSSYTNPYASYDPAPPLSNYYKPGVGVTADVLFLPPGQNDWSQAIVWPAFWYQPVNLAMIGSQQQGIVTGSGTWKVRAQLKQQGTWQARPKLVDANGTTLLAATSFSVLAPAAGAHGPLRVALNESTVLEYIDGTAFWPVGPNGDNTSTLASKYTNNVNLLRIWFSNQKLFGSGQGDTQAPWAPLNISDTGHFFQPGSAGAPTPIVTRLTSGGANTAAIYTFNQPAASTQAFLSCKRSTTYRWSCWINTSGLSGSGVVTAKLGPFFNASTVTSGLAGITDSRRVITTTAGSAPTSWTFFSGTYTTGASEDWFGGGSGGANPYLYLALESSTTGFAEIAQFQIQENLGGGNFGPNQVDLATGALDQVSQLASAMVDSIVADAEAKGIAIDAVLEDKNEVSWSYLNADGTIATVAGANQINIYNDLNTTQSGRLHKDLWRYFVARWGYSSAIALWEHLNEGDGGAAQQTLTNQLAGYTKSVDPNVHLFTTSVAAGVQTSFWAGMPNVDVDTLHRYLDTGDLKSNDWILPLVDNNGVHVWTWVTDTTYPGAIQLDCTLTQQWSLPFANQESGSWTVSCDINASAVTGGTFGFTGEGMSQLIAAGTPGWQSVFATFNRPSAALHIANLLLGAGTHTGGTGKIRNLAITSPSGKRIVTLIGDGTFPQQTDISQDAAAFHTAYDKYATARPDGLARVGQGVYVRPVIGGEWGLGSAGSNSWTAGLSSDTNLVWLHTFLFSGLAPGNLYDLWWPLAANLIDNNNGWGKFGQFLSFASGIAINNGKYVDIVASQAGQTNGAVVVVGQKDASNNHAHCWVRHNKFTWGNAVNNPTAWLPGGVPGQILTGTISFSGLANGSYNMLVNEFDATGSLTSSNKTVTVGGGVATIDLTTMRSTTTDAAFSITAPAGAAPLYALIQNR